MDYDNLDDDVMFNPNVPEIYKMLLLSNKIEDMEKGKCIAKLYDEFECFKKNNLFLMTYYKELSQYFLIMYKIESSLLTLKPAKLMTFSNRLSLGEYIDQIPIKNDKYYIATERNHLGDGSFLFGRKF